LTRDFFIPRPRFFYSAPRVFFVPQPAFFFGTKIVMKMFVNIRRFFCSAFGCLPGGIKKSRKRENSGCSFLTNCKSELKQILQEYKLTPFLKPDQFEKLARPDYSALQYRILAKIIVLVGCAFSQKNNFPLLVFEGLLSICDFLGKFVWSKTQKKFKVNCTP
jgi:hypothetical protein